MNRNTAAASIRNSALTQAISAALPTTLTDLLDTLTPAQQKPTPPNTAQQQSPQNRKTNPTPPPNRQSQIGIRQSTKPLNPNQLTAARLLLAGQSVSATAASLHLHPYTITRWKRDPRFQFELRRQVHLQANPPTARNTAQQKPTFLTQFCKSNPPTP